MEEMLEHVQRRSGMGNGDDGLGENPTMEEMGWTGGNEATSIGTGPSASRCDGVVKSRGTLCEAERILKMRIGHRRAQIAPRLPT